MIHPLAIVRRSVYSRAVVFVMALTVFAFMLGMNVARLLPQVAPSAASPTIEYITIFKDGYTDADRAAHRLNARVGYAVKRLRYAPTVHGDVRRRHVEAL